LDSGGFESLILSGLGPPALQAMEFSPRDEFLAGRRTSAPFYGLGHETAISGPCLALMADEAQQHNCSQQFGRAEASKVVITNKEILAQIIRVSSGDWHSNHHTKLNNYFLFQKILFLFRNKFFILLEQLKNYFGKKIILKQI